MVDGPLLRRPGWLGQGPRALTNGEAPTGASGSGGGGNNYIYVNCGGAGGAGVDSLSTNLSATGVDRPTSLTLTSAVNEVLTVDPGTGVQLPGFMNMPGLKCRIIAYGANDLLVYPLPGQTFFSGGVSNGVDQPLTMFSGNCAEFQSSTATTVYLVSST